MGVEYPKSVYCTGGRFNSTGAAESPDTQVAVYDFDHLVMTFELTLYTPYMLKISPQIRESLTEYPYWPQCATRIEIYGDQGGDVRRPARRRLAGLRPPQTRTTRG